MKTKTKFLIGFGLTFLISFIYFLIYFIKRYQDPLSDFSLFSLFMILIIPYIIYVQVSLFSKVENRILSENISWIVKYIFVLFLIICTLAIAEWDNITTMYPLIVSISLLFNWNTEGEKQVRQKSEKDVIEIKPKPVLPYLINFIILTIVFIIVSMCYYMIETIKDGIWTVIIIYGISFIIIYWIFYLVYRFLLRDTKIVQITKVGVIFISLYMIYYYCSSIDDMPYHLLLAYLLVSVVSLTTQNLILTRKRREER